MTSFNIKNELGKGIEVSPATLSKLERFIQGRRDEVDCISRSNHWVLKVTGISNLVFKMALPNVAPYLNGKEIQSRAVIKELFKNKLKAKEICITHQLELLVIPNAKKIKLKVDGVKRNILAEAFLEVDRNEFTQEELYYKYSNQLNETIRQLAIFVAKTGLNINWKSIPVIHEVDDQKPRRIALIRLSDMPDPLKGFTGDPIMSCRGLIRCVSKEQIDLVIDEAKKQKIIIPENEIQKLKKDRLDELECNEQLRQFHKRKGITGKEPLKVDVDLLGLDLTEKTEIRVETPTFEGNTFIGYKVKKNSVTLRKVAEDVITQINKALQNTDKTTLREKRYIFINTLEDPLRPYVNLNLPTGSVTEEQEKQLWLARIIQALIAKDHIFKLCKKYSYGYCIQA